MSRKFIHFSSSQSANGCKKTHRVQRWPVGWAHFATPSTWAASVRAQKERTEWPDCTSVSKQAYSAKWFQEGKSSVHTKPKPHTPAGRQFNSKIVYWIALLKGLQILKEWGLTQVHLAHKGKTFTSPWNTTAKSPFHFPGMTEVIIWGQQITEDWEEFMTDARGMFITSKETEGISTLFTISRSGRPPTPVSCSLHVTPTPNSEHGCRRQANTSHSWLTACLMVFPMISFTLKKKRLHSRSPFTGGNGQALFRATATFTCTRSHNCISHPRPGDGFHRSFPAIRAANSTTSDKQCQIHSAWKMLGRQLSVFCNSSTDSYGNIIHSLNKLFQKSKGDVMLDINSTDIFPCFCFCFFLSPLYLI